MTIPHPHSHIAAVGELLMRRKLAQEARRLQIGDQDSSAIARLLSDGAGAARS